MKGDRSAVSSMRSSLGFARPAKCIKGLGPEGGVWGVPLYENEEKEEYGFPPKCSPCFCLKRAAFQVKQLKKGALPGVS